MARLDGFAWMALGAAASLLVACGDDGSGMSRNCGDGIVQTDEGEACDDGNTTADDGCSPICSIDPGFECTGEPSECASRGTCGNGTVNAGEGCDDGEDGSAECNPPTAGMASCQLNTCGDGFPNSLAGEQCDDGNRTNGDGCSQLCLLEPDTCGDGLCQLDDQETCGNCVDDCDTHPSCNACEDGDDDGFHNQQCGGTDCNDDDPNVNPGMTEIGCNEVDDDCSPATDDFGDMDGDGSTCDMDCDDTDANVSPDLMEVCGNGVDDDCNGDTPDIADTDGDGFDCDVDCDDSRAEVNPDAEEICDNFLDDDCASETYDLFDADGDGSECAFDCNDANPDIFPGIGGTEVCGNGIDDDCDPSTPDLFDTDADGAMCDADCDDEDPERSPAYSEICGNGFDDDCNDGTLDHEDADGDGFFCEIDCDDGDDMVTPDAMNRCGPASDDYFSFDDGEQGWTVGGSNASWAQGAPTGEFITGPSAGAGAFATNLSGAISDDEDSHLTSPSFDFSAVLADPVLRFDLIHELGFADYGWVEISTDGGTTWRKIGSVGSGLHWYNDESEIAWEDDSGEAGEWVTALHRLQGAAGEADVRIRFRAETGFVFEEEGMGIDEVYVSNQLIDLAVSGVSISNAACVTDSQPIAIAIENRGAVTATSFDVSYQIDGGTVVTETVDVNGLHPGQTMMHMFAQSADLSMAGTRTIEVSVSANGDSVAGNDTLTREVEVSPTVDLGAATYAEDFESDSGGWATEGESSSWAHGMPTGTFINGANSGSNAWVTNLSGDYNRNELSFLLSPCFNLSSVSNDLTFRFARIFEIENGYDEAWVEVSIDGGEWTKLGTMGSGSGWYNDATDDVWDDESGPDGEWGTASHLISGTGSASTLRIRFVLDADGSVHREGFGLDDVLLGDDIVDLEVAEVDVAGSACGTSAAPVGAVIRNNGSTPMSSYMVSYTVDGGSTVTESGTMTIPAGGTVTHTFGTDADLSTPGMHTVEVTVTATGDVAAANDSRSADVVVAPNVTVDSTGYMQDFEADDGGWISGGENSSWAWGTPSGTFITAAANGTGAWATNLSGDYNNREMSFLASPCFDLSSLQSAPTISFSHIFETESCCDEGWLEVSTNGGETWTKLGNTTSGMNWYTDASRFWWDGNSGTPGMWRMASHALMGTAGMSSVRVRFLFSSDGSVIREGFGVDDVMITP